MQIKIIRGFPVTVICGGKKQTVRTVAATVQQIAAKAGIIMDGDDISSPKKNKLIKGKATITVKVVEKKQVTKTVRVDYETKVEYDEDMYEEKVYVKAPGKQGKATEVYNQTFIDGKLTKSELVSRKVTKKPVDKVVVRGSKPSLYGGGVASRVISDLTPPYRIDLDENDRPVKYKKKIVGEATSYCTGTVCSTGMRAQEGVVAVDPREIPYGTKMYIVSTDNRYVYGYCIAGDTGGFIYNSDTVVDLYISGQANCTQFGRRNVEIYVLE